MKKTKKVSFSSVLGIILLLAGLILFVNMPISGFIALILGATLFSPIADAIDKAMKSRWTSGFSGELKAIILIVGFLALFYTIGATKVENRASSVSKQETIQEQADIKVEQELLPYKILDEEVYDAPVKTQVAQHILVSGDITEDRLEMLLNNMYASTKDRTGFEHRTHPNAIYIYLYLDEERYESEMGQWVAMLSKGALDSSISIDINERQLEQLDELPEEKMGLSEVERKEIWQAYVKAEDRAWADAETQYPLPDPSQANYSREFALSQMGEQADLQNSLNLKYEAELLVKYKISQERLDEIVLEGLTKDWAFPKLKF